MPMINSANGDRPNPLNNREMFFESLNYLAKATHDPKLPYHNFDHALKTRNEAARLVAICKENSLVVDEDVVEAAALLHDGGYADSYDITCFSSKEAYAANLANDILVTLGMPQQKINKVVSAIMSTKVGVKPITLEEKIIRRADLENIVSNAEIFIRNNLLILDEYSALNGSRPSAEEWAALSYAILSSYLKDDVVLGEFDRGKSGESVFYERATKNVKLLLPENSDSYNYFVAKAQRGSSS